MNVVVSKCKEVLFSVLPIGLLVLILNFTVSPIHTVLLFRFFLGSFFAVLGLTVFLIGVDIGITPLGGLTGVSLAKTNKLSIVLTGGIIVGLFISIAEPGLMVLAAQVNALTSGRISGVSILVIVSAGLALMLAFGFLRIFYNVPLYKILMLLYLIIFVLSLFASPEFLAIAFDASGATTGVLAVPFILSLSAGISKLKKDSTASEQDSFGLVAIASTGAIMSVLVLDICTETREFSVEADPGISEFASVIKPFIDGVSVYFSESITAILPLFVILLVLQKLSFKLSKRELRKLFTGFIYTFLGLCVFLVGVNAGFMDVGTSIGRNLALIDNKAYIILIGFILGVVTILAEPAVHVLTYQIKDVTNGYVGRGAVLVPLAIGVGLAVALSVIRVLVPGIRLWHYLLPGYIICVVMMFFTPKLFVGIAFDTGGVATGPVTATFILAFIQGAAHAFEGADVMTDGFGMIAMVAMIPIITLEILGLVFALKSKTRGAEQEDGTTE